MGAWKAPPLPTGWRTASQPPFVGRARELDVILSVWPDVIAGSVHALFVTGEPGIGKTRLIAEAATRFAKLGSAAFVGSCVSEFGAPFEPLDVPLRTLLSVVRGSTAAGPASGLIRQAVSANDLEPDDRGGLPSHIIAQVDPSRLASAIVELIREAAESRPIVIVLDDLQWADETALRLLPRLIEGLASSRVLLLGGVRSTTPDRSRVADQVLASLHSFEGVRRIPLSPLTVDEVADYTRRRQIEPADAYETAARLSYLTGGNPFLLREAWRFAMEVARDRAGGFTLPESVNDLMRARLDSTDAAQRRLLQHAAVLGMDVVPDEVAATTGESPGVILEALDQALAAGLLESANGATDDLRFPHAIARQALLDSIKPSERATHHALAAGALVRISPTPPRLTQRLAYHYSHAISLGYRDQAIEQTAAVARLASSRGAHEEAALQFERAAGMCETTGARNELLLSAATEWRLAADFARARSLAERVCASGSPRYRLRGAIEYEESTQRPGIAGGRAVHHLRKALVSDPTKETQAERIEAMAALARAIEMSGMPDDTRVLAASATDQARTSGDEALLLRVIFKGYVHSLRPAGLREAYERTGEIWVRGTARSQRQGGTEEWLYIARNFRAAAAYVLGDRSEFEGSENALTEAAEQFGNYWLYWCDCLIYARNFVAGRLVEAREAYRRAAKTETGFVSDSRSTVAAQQLYMIKRELGELGSVRGVITGEESPHQHWAPGLLGLYTEFGMARPAARMLTWLREHERKGAHESGEWPAVLAFMTEAAVFLRDRDAAAQLRPLVAEYSGFNLMSGVFVSCFGAADRYLGQLDALAEIGDPGTSFEAALELDERLGAHLHAAHTRAETARWHASRGTRSREALVLADRVRVEASNAGWLRVLQIVERDSRLRGRVDGLTPREIEVLRLIDLGMTNREISVELHISEHTVANHIRNTLTKTVSANRSQAVRYARDHGLV